MSLFPPRFSFARTLSTMFALLDQIIFDRTFKAGAKTDFATGLAYKSEDNVFSTQTTKGER